MHKHPVPITSSALLVIDVQDSFTATPRWLKRNNPGFEANVARLIEAYRAAGLPVIYFLHSDDDAHFERSSPYYKLMDFLAPRENEPVLHKITRNVFTSTELVPLLVARGVNRVVISGIQTEQCCETSTRVAADLGFDVDFVTEATLTFPIPRDEDGTVELDTDAIVERTEYALRRRFARIANVDAIVSELGVALPA